MKTHLKYKVSQFQAYNLNIANEALLPGTLHGGEEIKPGTLHSIYTYRTNDGTALYKFRYVEISRGKYEIDIIEQPWYQGRDDSYSVSHRLSSARGGRKICVNPGYEPVSLHKAQKLSTEWAELTNTYIKTGISIDIQVRYR